MTPAIEYLIRTNLIKEWFSVPCSLFLYDKKESKKLVVTINEEFKRSDYYSVKHWHIGTHSDKQQALPFMTEYRVLKHDIFSHNAIIMKDHELLSYHQESIASQHNCYNKAMSPELYGYFYENTIESTLHDKKRMNWLWQQFVLNHAPNLCSYSNYIPSVIRSEANLANEQRDLISRYMKRQWKFWMMWQKHLLLTPGELVFYKEYLNVNN